MGGIDAIEVAVADSSRPALLSLREVDVLKHVARGYTDKQIGLMLGISQNTVHNHLSHIYEKLSAVNRTQAVLNAMRLGLQVL